MISRLKNTQWYVREFIMECLNKVAKKKKKDTFCTSEGRAIQIAVGSNLLDW